MAYSVVFKRSVSRDLKKLEPALARRIIDKIEGELPEKADKLPVLSGRFQGLRRFRIGDYRAIYTLVDDTVLVLHIRHRREVYR